MNINNKNVVVLCFVLSIAGCGTIKGGLNGLRDDFQSLNRTPGTSGVLVTNNESASKTQMDELYRLFLQPGVAARVAVQNAQDTFNATGSQKAWDMLVDMYFLGNNSEALRWLQLNHADGFALAIVRSNSFSVQEKQRAVETSCGSLAFKLFKEENFLSKNKIRHIKKACPQL